jgi:hypothetical protein
MDGIIDADTHVIESEEIWQYFDPALSGRKPALVAFADPTSGNTSHRWVIDGKLFPKPHGKGGVFLATPPMNDKQAEQLDWACRSLNDTATRLQHKDRMGVQTQVVYPAPITAFSAMPGSRPAISCAGSSFRRCNRSMPASRSSTSERSTARLEYFSAAWRENARSPIRTSFRSIPRRSASVCRFASIRAPVPRA